MTTLIRLWHQFWADLRKQNRRATSARKQSKRALNPTSHRRWK